MLALRNPLLAAGLLAAAAASQSSQTLPAGFDVTNGNNATAWPQSTASDHKWQWHYDDADFAHAGPITITELWVRAATAGTGVAAFDFPSWVVTLSEATTDYGVFAHDPVFANNLGPNTAVVRSGPWVGGPVPPSGGPTATWIPMGLQAPFVYDPTSGNDLIVQIEKCGTNLQWAAAMDGSLAAPGLNRGNRYGDIANCAGTTTTNNANEFVPIVRIDYTGGGATTTYCTAKTNSLGCVPAISGSGTPSASATSGFTLACAQVRNHKPGLLFYEAGGSQANLTFQCGTLCLGPSGIKRTPAQSAGGNPAPANDCSGTYSLDMNAFAAGLAGGNPDPALLVAGTAVHSQWWGRDQGFAAPCNTTLSDGAEFTVNP